MTPNRLRRSNNKAAFDDDEDLENDYGAALSSGKNSRRKSSVMRAQILMEYKDDDGFHQGSDAKRHLFESNQKKPSSTMRLM